jgi:hypothetical protein
MAFMLRREELPLELESNDPEKWIDTVRSAVQQFRVMVYPNESAADLREAAHRLDASPLAIWGLLSLDQEHVRAQAM